MPVDQSRCDDHDAYLSWLAVSMPRAVRRSRRQISRENPHGNLGALRRFHRRHLRESLMHSDDSQWKRLWASARDWFDRFMEQSHREVHQRSSARAADVDQLIDIVDADATASDDEVDIAGRVTDQLVGDLLIAPGAPSVGVVARL